MMKKVLVPLDGSSFSRQVVPQICRVLDPAAFEVILLQVAELPAGVVAAPPRPVGTYWPVLEYETERDVELAGHPIYATQVEQNVRAAIEDALTQDQRYLEEAGFKVDVLVRFGEPAREILNAARTEAVELVAMATHGRTGLLQLILGSVAEYVLRHLEIPVLMVRPFAEEA